MRLNETQKAALLQVLRKFKHDTKTCQICQTSNWKITDAIFELREFTGGQINLETDSMIYPVIPISCTKCGATLFLNALALGVLDPASNLPKEGQ